MRRLEDNIEMYPRMDFQEGIVQLATKMGDILGMNNKIETMDNAEKIQYDNDIDHNKPLFLAYAN